MTAEAAQLRGLLAEALDGWLRQCVAESGAERKHLDEERTRIQSEAEAFDRQGAGPSEAQRLRALLGQVVLLLDARALNFIRDDAETRTIAERWRQASRPEGKDQE